VSDPRDAFVERHRRLLRLEQRAEADEAERLLQTRSDAELVARGTTLLRLEVADLEPGFGGTLHAVLRPSRSDELPPHRFGPGDVVALRASRDEPATSSAVVVRARRDHVVVAIGDDDRDLPSIVRLDRLATDVTFRRLDLALRELGAEQKGERGRMLDVLFGERDASDNEPATIERWFDEGLDEWRSGGLYPGEVEYRLTYGDFEGEPYPWLFVDPVTLADRARAAGLRSEVVARGARGSFLARVSK